MLNVYPVIHHLNSGLTAEQAHLAYAAGADGVFLIAHGEGDTKLPALAAAIKSEFPSFKVGINLLSKSPTRALHRAQIEGLDMVWADDMGVSSNGLTQAGQALASARGGIELFASVAFKYQPLEPHPELAARNAVWAGFVPTTSGAATGKAPELEKIILMSKAADGCLAVASGMTPENIATFAPYLSDVLVATGVSLDEHHFDDKLLRLFITRARVSGGVNG